MKRRNGFTLIELLAVIVILAIIALIATPTILGVIEKAKMGAAKDSTYNYIEAVENYQMLQMLKNENGLEKGKYNVATETTINNIKYKKINDLVMLKGTKPSGGTINILENKMVGSSMLCINGYVTEYLNNAVSIVSDDCSEIENIIEYIVDKEGYQISRTLTINYPKGNYEYYYKVGGKAKIGEEIIEKDKEIKTTDNVSILLEENQTVETWMIKNGKKIAIKKYIEEEIDNIEIASVSIKETSSLYPLLTSYGVEYSSKIELEYENQEGTSPYYSIDDGKTWIMYEGIITKNISSNKIKAKMVRDKSKREGSIVEKEVSLASDALPSELYDGNFEAGIYIPNYTKKYLLLDSSTINASFRIIAENTTNIWVSFFDSNNNQIGDTIKTGTIGNSNDWTEIEFKIPNNAFKVEIYNPESVGRVWYEVYMNTDSTFDRTNLYPNMDTEKINPSDSIMKINYYSTCVSKLYKIDEGNWLNYNENGVKMEVGQTIYAKCTDKYGTETRERSYQMSNPLPIESFDGDDEYLETSQRKNYVYINEMMRGKKIRVYVTNSNDTNYPPFIQFLTEKEEVISTIRPKLNVENGSEYDIPSNAHYINYYPYNAWGVNDKLYYIMPVT